MRLIIVTAVACLAFFQPLRAQERIAVERIGVEQGLSQGFVSLLAQDREGFVWMGSTNGLSRFDGRRFRIFRNDPFDSLSLSQNTISAICDTADFLLVGTASGGLNFFHKKTERFFRVPFESVSRGKSPIFQNSKNAQPPSDSIFFMASETGKIPGSYISSMFFDKKGSLWLLVTESNLSWGWICRLDFPVNFWQKLPENPKLAEQLVCKKWKCMLKDVGLGLKAEPGLTFTGFYSSGEPLFLYDYYPVLFNDVGQTWEKFHLPDHLSAGIRHFSFSKNGKSSFWQGWNGETWFFDGVQNWQKTNLSGGSIQNFGQKYIFVQQPNAIEIFETAASPAATDFSKPRWRFERSDARQTFLLDRSDNFWWSELTEGVIKFSPRNYRFQHFLQGVYVGVPLYETLDGRIFFRSKVSGVLDFLNPKTNKIEPIGRAVDFQNLENCFALPDDLGSVWTLCGKSHTSEAMLTKTNLQTGASQKFEYNARINAQTVPFLDKNGQFYFFTDGVLVRFDTRTHGWVSFDARHLGMERQHAFGFTQTPDGSFWLATQRGLLQAKPSADTFQFEIFKNNPRNRNSPNCDNLASVATDTRDPFLLWIGTKGGGLNSFHTQKREFHHFSSRDGLPDDVIYGALPDDFGNVWMSSNRGIIRFNPATRELKNYLKPDGVQDLEFNTFAVGRRRNGDFMFGGVNGLNIFNPKSILDNPTKPSTRLVGLKLDNQLVKIGASDDNVLTADIGFSDEITLPFSKNNITLEFAALEFTAPSKNRFRYFLEGAEAEWSHETSENFASYLNLQPGQYVFKVVGSNNDGVFADAPATLKITVLAPWYRSNLAYFAYFLLVGSVAFGFWRTRENRHRLELELEKKQREAQETAFALEKKQQEAEQAAREFEAARREAEQIRESDRQQLALFTQNLMEKNLLIAALQKNQSRAATDTEARPSPADVEALYDTTILTRKDWENFKLRFERVHPGFQQNLAEKFSELSEAEFRLILLIKMGLKNAESAGFLGISPDSVKKARQRLRKKLQGLDIPLEDLI